APHRVRRPDPLPPESPEPRAAMNPNSGRRLILPAEIRREPKIPRPFRAGGSRNLPDHGCARAELERAFDERRHVRARGPGRGVESGRHGEPGAPRTDGEREAGPYCVPKLASQPEPKCGAGVLLDEGPGAREGRGPDEGEPQIEPPGDRGEA